MALIPKKFKKKPSSVNCDNVMIDMETLATTSDATILSIGAVKFDLWSDEIDDEGFYASITIKSNQDAGRVINPDTLAWWMKQSPEAQKVFTEPGKIELVDALGNLTDWMTDNKRAFTVWSNGASFDIPMLEHAYSKFHAPAPWIFWRARCFRTYKNLPGAKNLRPENQGVAHNALDDAITQARTAQLIHKTLFPMAKKEANERT